MSLRKLKSNFCCVCGRHSSDTTKDVGATTSKVRNPLTGQCSICIKKKSVTASDNTITEERSGDFFNFYGRQVNQGSKSMGKEDVKVGEKTSKKFLRNTGRVFDISANAFKTPWRTAPNVVEFHQYSDYTSENWSQKLVQRKDQKTPRLYSSALFNPSD